MFGAGLMDYCVRLAYVYRHLDIGFYHPFYCAIYGRI